jgi:hypothetical protein
MGTGCLSVDAKPVETLAGGGFGSDDFPKKIWAWVETLARF